MATAFNFIETDARVVSNVCIQSKKNEQHEENQIKVEPRDEEISKFVERSAFGIDDCEYQRLGTDPGLVVIFNHQTYDDKNIWSRMGTNRDVNELILTFGRLGYNIRPEYIFNDLTRKEILDILNQISKEDHTDRNSLIIAILTHGGSEDMIMARDDHLYTYEIWEPFSSRRCKTLENKPKFFIFQACKGECFSQSNYIVGDVVPTNAFTTFLEPDMLLAFSAVEGSQSYRHKFNGSWFVQELCRNFSAYGRRDDVLSLLIRTTKCVANNYYHIDVNEASEKNHQKPIIKQMPLFISTLTKRFYLTKSKDRNLLLDLLQQQQTVADALDKVRGKVDIMCTNSDERVTAR